MPRPTATYPGTAALTEARARRFALADDLLAGRTDRVALSRRGYDPEGLLVRARDVERMETAPAAQRRRA